MRFSTPIRRLQAAGAAVLLLPYKAFAATYESVGLLSGLQRAAGVTGSNGNTSLRQTVLHILFNVLSFMGLVAVIVIIIAGIRLVVSQGSDESKEAAKKTILYVVIGLILILIADSIVAVLANIGDLNVQ